MPRQVQRAVDDRLAQVRGVLGADDDVAQLARAGRRGAVAVDREREHVGRAASLPRCSRLSSRDPLGVDELDRDVAVVDAGRGERERAQPLDLGARRRLAAPPSPMTSTSSTAHGARRRSAGRSSGAAPLGVLVVGLDDPLHELVAHDVLAAEAHELDALDLLEDLADHDEPGALVARQVDLRDVAGDDHLRVEARAA